MLTIRRSFSVLQDMDEAALVPKIFMATSKSFKTKETIGDTTLTKVSIFKNSEEIKIEITLLGSVTNKHHMIKRRPTQSTQPVTNDGAPVNGRSLYQLLPRRGLSLFSPAEFLLT